MSPTSQLLTLAAVASTASAAYQGFNYGATFTTGAVKAEADFEAEFKAAANLAGTNGAFSSARLYTMIQGGTPNEPISAIPAAITTKTSLLFGLWASAGSDQFNNEIAALQNTIDQYCDQLDGLVAGISVGSEDLYRNSPTAIENGELAGASPDTLVDYIGRVRSTIQGTCLSNAPVGHVDTWTAYANSSNAAVIEACDWLGMDAYGYFEDTKPNSIDNGASLFDSALAATEGAAAGKEVWITETGWPVSGKDFGEAVPSPENAEVFWNEVGCPRFGKVNFWWYTLLDAAPDTPNPSFGVISSLGSEPLYDLSCSNADNPASSSSSTPSASLPVHDPAPEPPHSTTSEEVTTSPVSQPTHSTASEEEVTITPVPLPEPTSVSASTLHSVSSHSVSSALNTTISSANGTTVSSTAGTIPSASVPGDVTVTSVVPPAGSPTNGGGNPTQGPGSSPSGGVPAGGIKLNSVCAAGVAIFVAVAIL